MPFEWFVALRYMRDAKGQTALILAAVSIGVSVIVFLSALINGLQVSLIDKTLGSQAHVTLRVPREEARALVAATGTRVIARIVEPAPQRLRSIDQWPGVMADAEHRLAGWVATLDKPERFFAIIDIRKRIIAGRFDVTGGQVAIGSTLASDLAVGIGDKVRITTTEGVDDVVIVAGIFTLGNEGVDRTWMLTSLRHAQSLYALPGGATSTIEPASMPTAG